MSLLERVAKAIGECYDGEADPIDTPNNWKRALAAAEAAFEAMNDQAIEDQRRAQLLGPDFYPSVDNQGFASLPKKH